MYNRVVGYRNYLNNVVIYQKGDEVHEKKIIQYSPVYMYGIYNDTNGRWGGYLLQDLDL